MIDLSTYNPQIGCQEPNVPEWLRPVIFRGRGAAFVDTGFLKALIDQRDQYHDIAKAHLDASVVTNFYSTSLVLNEVVRQIAKEKGIDYPTRNAWFGKCTELFFDHDSIYVCQPPRDIIIETYDQLSIDRDVLPDLDLCDALSINVLKYAKHNRVFGFDSHLTIFGASIEPVSRR